MNPVFDIAAFRFEDPFGSSADPARYVPREATERALAQLEERAIGERRNTLLAGVPGIGKTLLLRILRGRFSAATSVVHLRYPALPAPALFAWALQELDGPASYDPVGALVALAAQRETQGGDIVLLVDDAETLPTDSAQALFHASEQTQGALRIVAAGDRETLGPLVAQLQDANPIWLVEPMSAEETSAYIAAHLEARGLTAAAGETFSASALAELHASTRGIPARVNADASRLLRRAWGPRFVAPPPQAETESATSPASTARAAAGPEATTMPLAAAATATPKRDDAASVSQHEAIEPPPAGRTVVTPADTPPPGLTPASRPLLAAPEPESDSDAALERAAGRLALAQQGVLEGQPTDPALERAADRLALANTAGSAASADAAAAHSDPQRAAAPEASEPVPSVETATASENEPVANIEPTPATPTAAAPTRSEAPSAAKAPAVPKAKRTKFRERRQPPLSLIASAFVGCLAAGALFGTRLLDAPSETAKTETALSLPAPNTPEKPQPVAAVSAPAPVPVQINARPWAEIYIDGAIVGVTPLAGLLLAPGPHVFEVRFPNGTLETHTLEIDAQRRHLTFPRPAEEAAGTE